MLLHEVHCFALLGRSWQWWSPLRSWRPWSNQAWALRSPQNSCFLGAFCHCTNPGNRLFFYAEFQKFIANQLLNVGRLQTLCLDQLVTVPWGNHLILHLLGHLHLLLAAFHARGFALFYLAVVARGYLLALLLLLMMIAQWCMRTQHLLPWAQSLRRAPLRTLICALRRRE